MHVEILLQPQSSFQDTDGVVRLLFQLQTPRSSAGKRNVIVHAKETVLYFRFQNFTHHAKDVFCHLFFLLQNTQPKRSTTQSLSQMTPTKISNMIAFDKKENLHVHLVRPRFVLFLWEAAQYNGSNGPLQKIERFHSKHSSYFNFFFYYFAQKLTHHRLYMMTAMAVVGGREDRSRSTCLTPGGTLLTHKSSFSNIFNTGMVNLTGGEEVSCL